MIACIQDRLMDILITETKEAIGDWYVKAEDIVLKNKSNQNAGNPQNHAPQGQPKK